MPSPSEDAQGPLTRLWQHQAQRYGRVLRRRSYPLTGTLAAFVQGEEPHSARAGMMQLELTPTKGAPYGWVLVELEIAAHCERDATTRERGLLEGLHLRVPTFHGPQSMPLFADGPQRWHGSAYLPPGTTSFALVGMMPAPGEVRLVSGRVIEVSRQEVFARALAPRLPNFVKKPEHTLARLKTARMVWRAHGMPGIIAQLHSKREALAYDYETFVARHDTLTDADRARITARISEMVDPPHFSVLVPTYNTPIAMLEACIRSVTQQLYPHWELCIADDASDDPDVRALLEQWAAKDARIKLCLRKTNGHIAAASNSALALATKPWLALLDHDDELRDHALYMMAEEIVAHPDVGFLYSDEDKLDENNRRCDPYFKPDFNYDLLLASNYVTHFSVYKKACVDKVGGFRSGFDGSQDYDLVLRVTEELRPQQIRHVPHVLYHWRISESSAASQHLAKPYAMLAAERAIAEHLARKHPQAYVHASAAPGMWRVQWPLPSPAPHVTLLIPTRDSVALLSQCIDSILTYTAYPSYDIVILDNGSTDALTHLYFKDITKRPDVSVLPCPGPFNFAELCNRGVAVAKGEFVALINNDIEAEQHSWLSEMVSLASRRGIGAVGAQLLYPDGLIQHAGVVMGMGGVASHPFNRLSPKLCYAFGQSRATRAVAAVTAACLVVRKSHYQAVGGMDDKDLAVAFNDVDFCLRLAARGLVNIVTPNATLIHHESASRGNDVALGRKGFADESQTMYRRYGALVGDDPLYNPNLTLENINHQLARQPRRSYPFRCPPDEPLAPRPQFVRTDVAQLDAASSAGLSARIPVAPPRPNSPRPTLPPAPKRRAAPRPPRDVQPES